MSSDDIMSPFTATSVAVPVGSSICNNMTHTVNWTISDYLAIQVDGNAPENFSFNGFTPCRDLNVPLYLGGIKGTSFQRQLLLVFSMCAIAGPT